MTRNSDKARKICFEGHREELRQNGRSRFVLYCHVCKAQIDPLIQKWEADHIRRYSEGGEDTVKNLHPICIPCHDEKSRRDTSEVAKGKRVAAKAYGVKQPKGGFVGWRRFDGTIVWARAK